MHYIIKQIRTLYTGQAHRALPAIVNNLCDKAYIAKSLCALTNLMVAQGFVVGLNIFMIF